MSWRPERVGNVDTEKIREKSLNIVKTYKVIKNVIWQSAIEVDGNGQEIPRKDQTVDIKLLLGLMDEI